MYAVVILRYTAPLEQVIAATEDHRSYLRSLKERGILLVSGPFEPRTGGALLFRLPEEGPTLEEIRDGDPFHQRGLAAYDLHVWRPGIGAEDLGRL